MAIAPASQRAFSTSSVSTYSTPSTFTAHLQRAVSWLQGQSPVPTPAPAHVPIKVPTGTFTTSTTTTNATQAHAVQRQRGHSLLLHNTTTHPSHPHQPYQHLNNTALFSTSGAVHRLSKEEEDLYQALTISFRNRIAEQVHRPEDSYKSVIEHWTAQTHNSPQQQAIITRQRTKARKERLALATKHKDLALIQREQEKLRLETPLGTADEYFYVIQAWIRCQELKRATLAFEKMERQGIPLQVRTLAAMIRAHARSGNMAVAGTMVQKLADLNVHPDSIYDLSALLEYYIKLTPNKPLASLKGLGVTATTAMSTAAAAAAAGQREQEGTDTSSSSTAHSQVQQIWKLIEPRLKIGTSVTANNNAVFSYRTYLVYLVQRAQDLEEAVDLIEKMVQRGLSPELEKYQRVAQNVLGRLIEHGYLTEVQKLLEQQDTALGKALSSGTSATPSTSIATTTTTTTTTGIWSDLMEAYMNRGEYQKSRWIYNDMLQHGIVPDVKCRKLFSNLQVMGGTKDEGSPLAREQHRHEQDLLSLLFQRAGGAPKPAIS
ncbi:hypothetical protein BG004_006079 [Podila humilis]|nr:hypothetical protein BG004_006079 [Podila humilis]